MNKNEYIVSEISTEILSLEKYKYNLKKTAFNIVINKEKGFSKQYYKILDEIERVAIEIHTLENQKSLGLTILEIENHEISNDFSLMF
jgi:hypothetical protein